MSVGPWQIILVVVLIVLLFGRGKISELMGDVAKGIKSFRKGLKDDEETAAERPTIGQAAAQPHEAPAAHKQETPHA